jgi:Uma2 family endonuclease
MGTTTTTLLSVDEFLRLPEKPGVKQELLEGVIIEMAGANAEHELIKATLNQDLTVYAAAQQIGMVFPEAMYILAEGEAYIPDLSLQLRENIRPSDRTSRFQGAPDLAIEVVSSESAADLEKKVLSYLRHGCHAVWVVFPELRVIHTYDRDGSSHMLRESDTLECAKLLPGFRLPVSRIFAGA